MSTPKPPKAPATPDPIPQEVTDESASDLLSLALKRRKGRRTSFITRGQRANQSKSLLSGNKSQL